MLLEKEVIWQRHSYLPTWLLLRMLISITLIFHLYNTWYTLRMESNLRNLSNLSPLLCYTSRGDNEEESRGKESWNPWVPLQCLLLGTTPILITNTACAFCVPWPRLRKTCFPPVGWSDGVVSYSKSQGWQKERCARSALTGLRPRCSSCRDLPLRASYEKWR